MNKNLFKIIEKLGYRVEYDGGLLRIYDQNNQLLKKYISSDEIHKGVDYKSENGPVIHFDNDDFMSIYVDDNTTIVAHNLYEDHNDNSISVYCGQGTLYDLVMHFDVCKNNIPEARNGVFVSTYESTLYLEEDDYFIKELSIIENDNGAVISLFNEDIRHLSVDECTKENYLSIIVNFLGDIDNKNIRDNIQKGFDIIAPCFMAYIDDYINSLESNTKKKH